MSILIKGMEIPKNGVAIFGIRPDGIVEDVMGCFVGKAIPVPPRDSEAFEKVISERMTQIAKWGDESSNHPFEWMSILGEEFGELCEAVNETCFRNGTHRERGGTENIIREAAQIAAVAITIIRDFAPTIIPADQEEKDH